MSRAIRYQGVVIRDNHILLLKHQEHAGRYYWVIPGGGREVGETEEACVQREMLEKLRVWSSRCPEELARASRRPARRWQWQMNRRGCTRQIRGCASYRRPVG